ncbi:MAG: RNA-binding protein [Acidobacteria bacterium]|nr:RNA-binding protein [Acidobacteriota bacterium]
MGRRLYVGNLPYKTTDEDLQALFGQAGAVESVRVMRDLTTGRARGFAFVQMASDADAQKAVEQFHEYQLDGRALVVNEARPKPAVGGGRGDFAGGGFGGPREPRW